MFTFTFSHERCEPVGLIIDDTMTAWAGLYDSAAWDRIQAASQNRWVRNTEVTYTDWHGAHGHHHILVCYDTPPTADQVETTRQDLLAAWTYQAAKLGRRVDPIAGVDAQVIEDDAGIGAYVSKVVLEMTRSDRKISDNPRRNRSRSHWEIALDAATSSNPNRLADRHLWREFMAAMSRHRFLGWSQPLRKAFRKSDEEVAEEAEPMEVLVYFTPQIIRLAQHHRAITDIRYQLALGRPDTPDRLRACLQEALGVPLELVPTSDGVPLLQLTDSASPIPTDRADPALSEAPPPDDHSSDEDSAGLQFRAGGGDQATVDDEGTGLSGSDDRGELTATDGMTEFRRWARQLGSQRRADLAARTATLAPGPRGPEVRLEPRRKPWTPELDPIQFRSTPALPLPPGQVGR